MNETETREAVKEERTRRSSPKTAAALILVLVIAAALLTVGIVGGGISASAVRQTWRYFTDSNSDAEFTLDNGFDTAFADLGSAVVTSGALGVVIYDNDGAELAREAFSARNPAIAAYSDTAVAYDVGGRVLKIADVEGNISSMTMENDIISCAVGGSGGLFSGGTVIAVCMQGPDNYKGYVVFYKPGGVIDELYKWYSGDGYTLAAAISPKNGDFAVLTLTPRGGRVVILDRSSTEIKGEYIHSGAAIIEIAYMKSGALIARTADGLISIDGTGAGETIVDFGGHSVAGYSAAGDQFVAVFLSESAAGDSAGELITYDERGRELSRMRTSRSPVWIQAKGDRLAVLWRDGLDIYDRSLKLTASYPDASGLSFAAPRGKARAIALGSRQGKAFSGKTD